jgi:DNA-binding response OmpR family regulator
MRILAAEDHAPLAECQHQRLVQFAVQTISKGAEAEQLALDQTEDLVDLDRHLLGTSRLDVLRKII